jgi:hypothetical protein
MQDDDTKAVFKMLEHLTEEVARMRDRLDENTAETLATRQTVDDLRAEWMRRTLNGRVDTEPPPTTTPTDVTPPRGRRFT